MGKEKFWFDGKISNNTKDLGNFSLGALHYGTAVFDGILCIRREKNKGCHLFRLSDHINRLFYSAKIIGQKIPYNKNQFSATIIDLIKSNSYGSYYIRPLIFGKNVYTKILPKGKKERDVNVIILCKKINFWRFMLHMNQKIKVAISRKVRNSWEGELAQAKISGKYLNSFIALEESKQRGFSDAIILDRRGMVSEASCSNIFTVKKGKLKTPDAKNILPGVTRNSVIEIAREEGYHVDESKVSVEELVDADEIFLCNTAQGIISVSQIEGMSKSYQCKTTKLVREKYVDIIKGKKSQYKKWLTLINF